MLSFVQDKTPFVKADESIFQELLSVKNNERLPGLIVPVNKGYMKDYYDVFRKYFKEEAGNKERQNFEAVDFSTPIAFFMLSVFLVNKTLEMNFKRVLESERDLFNNKVINFASGSKVLTDGQKKFVELILNRFENSTILKLQGDKTISIDLKLYIISIMAMYYSLEKNDNFMTQTIKGIKSHKLEVIFLNFRNALKYDFTKVNNAVYDNKIKFFYKCRTCGTRFGKDQCGKANEVRACAGGCGQVVGGAGHKLNANTIKIEVEKDEIFQDGGKQYNLHEFLRDDHHTFRTMNRLCFRFLHSMMHAFYLGAVETGLIQMADLDASVLAGIDENYAHLKLTDHKEYFIKHIDADFEFLQRERDQNHDQFRLFTTIITEMLPEFASVKTQVRTENDYDQYALKVGESFIKLLNHNNANSFAIEKDIEIMIEEIDKEIKDVEPQIIQRKLDFNHANRNKKMNRFVFQHLRNSRRPDVLDMIHKISIDIDLKNTYKFILDYYNHQVRFYILYEEANIFYIKLLF